MHAFIFSSLSAFFPGSSRKCNYCSILFVLFTLKSYFVIVRLFLVFHVVPLVEVVVGSLIRFVQ